jgi:biopolymer transport protein ExbD
MRFSIRLLLAAFAIVAICVWLVVPSPNITIRINPAGQCYFDNEPVADQSLFWQELSRQAKRCSNWGLEPNVTILASDKTNHSDVAMVMFTMSPIGVENYSIGMFHSQTGKILSAPSRGVWDHASSR